MIFGIFASHIWCLYQSCAWTVHSVSWILRLRFFLYSFPTFIVVAVISVTLVFFCGWHPQRWCQLFRDWCSCWYFPRCLDFHLDIFFWLHLVEKDVRNVVDCWDGSILVALNWLIFVLFLLILSSLCLRYLLHLLVIFVVCFRYGWGFTVFVIGSTIFSVCICGGIYSTLVLSIYTKCELRGGPIFLLVCCSCTTNFVPGGATGILLYLRFLWGFPLLIAAGWSCMVVGGSGLLLPVLVSDTIGGGRIV